MQLPSWLHMNKINGDPSILQLLHNHQPSIGTAQVLLIDSVTHLPATQWSDHFYSKHRASQPQLEIKRCLMLCGENQEKCRTVDEGWQLSSAWLLLSGRTLVHVLSWSQFNSASFPGFSGMQTCVRGESLVSFTWPWCNQNRTEQKLATFRIVQPTILGVHPNLQRPKESECVWKCVLPITCSPSIFDKLHGQWLILILEG